MRQLFPVQCVHTKLTREGASNARGVTMVLCRDLAEPSVLTVQVLTTPVTSETIKK